MSVVIQIADAVVANLNAGTFTPTFVAARRYLPHFDLANLASLQVTVVPKGCQRERKSRQAVQLDVAIDIAVQKKVAINDQAEIDTLMNLCEQIADHLTATTLPGLPQVAFLKAAHEPIFAVEHLDQYHAFTGLLTVVYRTMGSIT